VSTVFHANLYQSAADFQSIVWPALSVDPRFGGGDLRSVEATTTEQFADELDTLSGIDGWQIMRDLRVMRGLASRVQWGRDYRSFTVRCARASGAETEFAKRLNAIRDRSEGYLFPHWTIQAYLDERGGRLLSAAAVPTERLIEQIERLRSWGRLENASDSRYGLRTDESGTGFYYVSWEYLLHTALADAVIVWQVSASA
jgi:hypothetical protein